MKVLIRRLLLHAQTKINKCLTTSCRWLLVHAHNFLHCSCINWHSKGLSSFTSLSNDKAEINIYESLFLEQGSIIGSLVWLFRNDIWTFSQWPRKELLTSTEITHWTPRINLAIRAALVFLGHADIKSCSSALHAECTLSQQPGFVTQKDDNKIRAIVPRRQFKHGLDEVLRSAEVELHQRLH